MDVLEELTAVAEVPAQREPESDKKYSLVVAEYSDGDRDIPDVLMTVKEFATELTFKNFEQGIRKQVEVGDVYNAMKAKRHPLPVVLVDDQAYLSKEAFDAWENRPVRGEGTSAVAASKRSDEDLVKLAGEAQKKLAKTAGRIEKLLNRRDKEAGLVQKYVTQLVSRFGDEEAANLVGKYIAANPDENKETD